MRRILIVLLSLSFTLVGCTTNPVTGEKNFILPNLDEDWERQVGAQMYAPMRQAEGGDYILDPDLTAYVEGVGQRLAAQSKRDLPYDFHVLNNSVPNAWALPGGKIVVNRGLLTELDSEAELAAVLGHEIVHADAAHGARQQSKGLLTQVGMMAAMIYGSSQAKTEMGQQIAMMVPQLGAQLITTKYGRDAERESDLYGMQYMSAAGYNPQGAVELQETFVKLSEGRNSDWLSGLFASHPASRERVANNRATARTLPQGGEFGRETYMRKTARLREKLPAYEAYDKARKALKEDDFEKARQLNEDALRMEPREALFHALSGDIHAARDELRKAEKSYNEAVKLNDGFFYNYLRRGQVRYERGEYGAARSDLEHSLKLLPTGDAHYILGKLDKRSGDMDAAVHHYRQAAEAGNRQAQTELVLLELPSDPGKYIQGKAALAEDGYVHAAVRNNSSVTVSAIRAKVEYINADGNLREVAVDFRKTLGPGEWTSSPTSIRDIKDSNELARRVRVTVTGARVADSK